MCAWGGGATEGDEDGDWGFLRPKENVFPAARKDNGWVGGIADAGARWASWGFGSGLSSKGISVDEGNVEDELKRAEAEDSSWPPLEEELLVPALPLMRLSE